MHLWNDINPLKIKSHVRAVIEISEGSRQKYVVDPELGILTLDHILLVTDGESKDKIELIADVRLK